MPADLYFACLDGIWNFDGDHLWGEPGDGDGGGEVDLLAEVYLGRAPVDTIGETERFVNKTIGYERHGQPNSASACFLAEYFGQYGDYYPQGGVVMDTLLPHFSHASVHFLDDRPYPSETWDSADCLNALNRSPHIVAGAGHSWYDWTMRLVPSDLDLLTNQGLFLVYGIGCWAGAFENRDCMAELFINNNDSGAFASIMNSRIGFFEPSDPPRYSGEFMEAFFEELLTQGHANLGAAHQLAKHDMIGSVETSGNMTYRYCYFELNLLGDPHTPLAGPRDYIVTGPGPGADNPPLVRGFDVADPSQPRAEFSAYAVEKYGVNLAVGNIDGHGLDEVVTGPGPGAMFGPHVRGFRLDGSSLPGISFLAYGTHKWGVEVATGDIDADGCDEIITGAGPGAVFGPHVRGWNCGDTGTVTAVPGVSFFAYGTPKWGVKVSAGDIDGDGHDEIVTGAGPGAIYGPHVRGWNVDGGAAAAIPGVSFLAYGTNRFGVNVTCGDVDGDGIDEMVTGAGPSAVFGAHVRGWNYDGESLASISGINFFAWPPGEVRYGASVFAGADLNDDGRDEIVVGAGPDPAIGSPVTVFLYDGAQVSEWVSLQAFNGMTHGTSVAAGRF
jgi:hypothetical protein